MDRIGLRRQPPGAFQLVRNLKILIARLGLENVSVKLLPDIYSVSRRLDDFSGIDLAPLACKRYFLACHIVKICGNQDIDAGQRFQACPE